MGFGLVLGRRSGELLVGILVSAFLVIASTVRMTVKLVLATTSRRTAKRHYEKAFFHLGFASAQGPGTDWFSMFNESWMTRDELEMSEHGMPDADEILTAYARTVGSLRNGKIPWKIENLFLPEGEEWHPATEITDYKQFEQIYSRLGRKLKGKLDIRQVLQEARAKGIIKDGWSASPAETKREG